MRDPSNGQASVEYVAVLAVVAGLFALLAVTAFDGTAVARRVTREVARTLCLVRAGDCDRDQEPCVMAADGERNSTQGKVLFFRFGGDTTILVEQRSDGTYAVTHVPHDLYGAEVAVGGKVGLDTGGLDVGVSAELQAGLLARLGDGRTWIVDAREQADALLAALGEEQEAREHERRAKRTAAPVPVPPPDVTYDEDELEATIAAAVTGSAGIELADVRASYDHTRGWGVRVDRRTGRRTLYLATGHEGGLSATSAGGLLDERHVATAAHESYAVELDAARRPVDLVVTAIGDYTGSADLPAAVSPVAGRLAVEAGRGERRYEVTAHLDLTVPANRTAAGALIAAIGDRTADGAQVRAAADTVRARLDSDATVEARLLAAEEEDRGVELEVSVLGGLGAGIARSTWNTRLLAAASRGGDGEWLVRSDCAA